MERISALLEAKKTMGLHFSSDGGIPDMPPFRFACVMRFSGLLSLVFLAVSFLSFRETALASAVINEVMWMGTDLSASDEWVEIFSAEGAEVSGWKLQYVSSKGEEKTIVTFASGTVMEPKEYFIIARQHADASGLLVEPKVVTPSMTLLNDGLVLRLYNAAGELMDEVHAGDGTPFAGANPSGGIGRASMERIDPNGPGSEKSNWRTATISQGFDDGAQVFGTPGSANVIPSSSEASSSAPSSSSGSSPSSSSSSSSSSCYDPLLPVISIQSGLPVGVGKVTVNFQVIAASGSLTHATCYWQFGDGTGSSSCNPPAKTYGRPGTYIAQVDVKNQCDNTLVLTQTVEVLPPPEEAISSYTVPFDSSRVILTGALPNPPAADKEKEWFELRNLEDREVNLLSWKIELGTLAPRRYALRGITVIGPLQAVRLYRSETELELQNSEGKVSLLNPDSAIVSTIHWTDAEEGRVYKPDDFRREEVRGTVTKIMDGDTFHLALDPASQHLLHEESVTVRLLGIDAPETVDPRKAPEPYGAEASESLRALIEEKNVELFFDTEVWDSYGRLLAYVYVDGSRMVQEEMLKSGLAETFRKYSFAFKERFLETESLAKTKRLGMWASVDSLSSLITGLAQVDTVQAAKVSSSVPVSITGTLIPRLSISEIYPSPRSSPKGSRDPKLLREEEWVEIYNPGDDSYELFRWSISDGKKRKSIGTGWLVGPQSTVVLFASNLGLKFVNKGGEISLRSPDGSYLHSVRYPSIPIGSSYIPGTGSRLPCIASSPTPWKEGGCTVAFSGGNGATVRAPSAVRRGRASLYATSYLQDVRAVSGSGGQLLWEERPSNGQLVATIVISFLAGLFSFAAVQSLLLFFRNRKKMG